MSTDIVPMRPEWMTDPVWRGWLLHHCRTELVQRYGVKFEEVIHFEPKHQVKWVVTFRNGVVVTSDSPEEALRSTAAYFETTRKITGENP